MFWTPSRVMCAGALLLVFVCGAVAGGAVVRWLMAPGSKKETIVKTESFQPEKIHAPNARTVERTTANRPPRMPRKNIPGQVVRVTETQVRAETPEPVKLEIVQSEDSDGSHVTIQADGGEILQAHDFVTPRQVVVYKDLHWNAQILQEIDLRTNKKEWGGQLGYERGRLIASFAVFPEPRRVLWGAGWRW